jgi:hypothetical protein
MTDNERIAQWKSITGIKSDELAGFFQAFRPHGAGVERALRGVVRSDVIVPRLMEIYEAPVDGYPTDVYFIVRKPTPLSRDDALHLAILHRQKLNEISKEAKSGELAQLLRQHDRSEVVVGQRSWPPNEEDPETLVDEVVTDYVLSLSPERSQALLLREALYNMACDTYIRDYVLWPLYQESTSVLEPFEPYFKLWKHSAGFRFDHDGSLKVYVPSMPS